MTNATAFSEVDPLDFSKPIADLRAAIAVAPTQTDADRENDLCLTARAAYHAFMDMLAFARGFDEHDRTELHRELLNACALVTGSEPIRKSIQDKINAIQIENLNQFVRQLDELAFEANV